ncbi:uncharacterized protein PV09_07797 [Verruconis gallopava]|uniref:Inactive metallocarboxypeptidase ECM14 n=1 Tax=Verruconis gallopava TaxID=253628 RepID=A0A0D2ANA5_9PEZI|nr:uncharacterized protein PV09_07797 [Verruconis gallopava]KIW00599.1 hypothetical protein PV09_07797 [Verruconis gallopava]
MRTLFLLAVAVAHVVAVPPAPPGRTPVTTPTPQASWRRLSNWAIAKIWGKCKSNGNANRLATVFHDTSSGGSRRAWSRYGQDIVLRFNISTAEDAIAVGDASRDLYLDVWEFNDNWVDVRLAKNDVPILLALLPQSLQNAHMPLMPHVGLADIISQSLPTSHAPFAATLEPHSKDLFFSDYQPLSVISPWLRLMSSMFPTHVRLINIGVSWEGRDIPALRVGVHPTNDEYGATPRRTIVLTGGIHAREWISISTVLYVANAVITSYGKDRTWTNLLESFDWIFIPTLNPDGYVYTWETDRLWRKNRQPTSLRFCSGIDLDRAFGFEWTGDASGGNPCAESFAGEEPWQAAEAQRFAAWARNETESGNTEFVALLDLHSYSQQVLYPYSYSCEAAPPTLEDLEEIALGLAKAMRMTSHGRYYKTTSACEGNVAVAEETGRKEVLPRIESGGGSLLDWMYHDLRVRYAYQIKLRDTGSYGFLLPKENIVPQGKEVLNAVTYLGKFLTGQIGMEEENAQIRDPETMSEVLDLTQAAYGIVKEVERAGNLPAEPVIADSKQDMVWELRRRR